MKETWPADKVERRAVASLVPYARNARTHSDEQVAQIAASIREWGWTVPVLVDETGGIIAGHGRILAAQRLGIADVPCMVADGWTEAQKRAYVLADNKLALNAGWDMASLAVELGELGDLGFDLGLTGFSLDEIGSITAEKTAGLTDPDEVPEPPVEPVSVLGGQSIHAIELDPAYVDVAVKRWQAFTGQDATLENDGRTFAEIEAERIKDAA